MPDERSSREPPAKTVPFTIRLSVEDARTLLGLAEIFHATPERMVASWAEYQIERLAAGLAPDHESSIGLRDGSEDA